MPLESIIIFSNALDDISYTLATKMSKLWCFQTMPQGQYAKIYENMMSECFVSGTGAVCIFYETDINRNV